MLRHSLLIVFVALLPYVFCEDELELGDSDFDSTLEQHDTALVMFYAPWCGHCKRLKPEFTKAAGILKDNDPPVQLAKVDCTEAGKDTCGRFEVRGYPTLKIFRNGELSQDYNGPREVNGIVKYMKAQVGPASKEVKTEDELKALLAKPEVVVVSYLTDDKEKETFAKVASKMRENVAFGHYTGSTKESGIKLYRPAHLKTKMEDAVVDYDGTVDKDFIEKWVKANYHGLVGHRTLDNAADFKEPLAVAYFAVDYTKNPKGTNYWRNRIMKVAKKFEGITFAISNKDDLQQEATEFGIEVFQMDKPSVALKANGLKYVMTDDFSVESLEKFIKDFKAGSLEPYLKSEPVPDSQGNVKVAVAKNFDELVTKSEKDSLVEFYAPWCGHCKKLAPVYDELGDKMKDENVNIVKMDATANDVPASFDVRGFPTIYWVPKGGKPVTYNGGREVDDFVKYIAKEATDELKGFDRKGNAKKEEL